MILCCVEIDSKATHSARNSDQHVRAVLWESMHKLAKNLAGRFIVFDGPDGAGKSTQLRSLREFLTALGCQVDVVIDPGTTKIGQKIRSLLLDRDNGEIGPMCETLLFMASRAQLIHERIRPALEQGKVVLCDRFVTATIAYQGASGVDHDLILQLAEVAIEKTWPDLTLILDLPVKEGFNRLGIDRTRLKRPQEEEMQRLSGRSKHSQAGPGQLFLFGDRMESRSSSYHERVVAIFKELHEYYPGKVEYVDAIGTEDEVFSRVTATIAEQFSE